MSEHIVIPMAGGSRRFAEAGYAAPKYRLEVGGQSLFHHAVGSFRAYFEVLPFLFILRGGEAERAFVESECRALGIAKADIVVLDRPTRGQAETVALGLDAVAVADATPLTIFNIDTVRPGFRFPLGFGPDACDGALEVFCGEGDHWSFVRAAADGSDAVVETAEKRRISALCSTGLYRFARAGDFRRAFEAACAGGSGGEIYVAPLYNHLIAAGMDVRYWRVDAKDVIFSGIPAEYEAFKRAYESAHGRRLAR